MDVPNDLEYLKFTWVHSLYNSIFGLDDTYIVQIQLIKCTFATNLGLVRVYNQTETDQ